MHYVPNCVCYVEMAVGLESWNASSSVESSYTALKASSGDNLYSSAKLWCCAMKLRRSLGLW